MRYKQMLAFKMVMQVGSISAAAKKIHISQPAVSNHIAALEQQLGFPLFERRKGRLIPTPDAHYMYEQVQKALSGFEHVEQAAHDIREHRTGSLRIASMPGFSNSLIPELIAEFLAERKGITVTFQTQPSLTIQRWIASDLYDVGFAEMPLIHSGIDCEKFKFNCVCCLPKGHPLLSHKVITPADLDGLPLITLNNDHMTYSPICDAFTRASAELKIVIQTQLFWSAASLVSHGCGIAIIDPFTASFFASDKIEVRPFLPNIEFNIGILNSSAHPKSLLAKEFIKLLQRRLIEAEKSF